jgi:hypothetical protein
MDKVLVYGYFILTKKKESKCVADLYTLKQDAHINTPILNVMLIIMILVTERR